MRLVNISLSYQKMINMPWIFALPHKFCGVSRCAYDFCDFLIFLWFFWKVYLSNLSNLPLSRWCISFCFHCVAQYNRRISLLILPNICTMFTCIKLSNISHTVCIFFSFAKLNNCGRMYSTLLTLPNLKLKYL